MADQVVATVEKIDTKTLERKDGKGTFDITEVTAGGKTYKGFTNKLGELPVRGDKVEISYQAVKNGKFTNNNIVSLNVLDGGHVEVAPTVKATVAVPVHHEIVKTTTLQPTSKDVSMEVSGLLQALISTGNYHDTGLNLATLEDDLRLVLTLKRKVAKDVEHKG